MTETAIQQLFVAIAARWAMVALAFIANLPTERIARDIYLVHWSDAMRHAGVWQ